MGEKKYLAHPLRVEFCTLFLNSDNFEAMKQTLKFLRIATAKKDGYDGFLFLHVWSTGWQELIFSSMEKAQKFIDDENSKKL